MRAINGAERRQFGEDYERVQACFLGYQLDYITS
jgi:hypothetical protein